MQVDCRHFEVAMPKQYLNRAQIGAGFKKVGRETVAQSVGMNAPVVETCAFAAIWQADHRTLVVTGWLDVCQRLPGNSHSFGLRRSPRQ